VITYGLGTIPADVRGCDVRQEQEWWICRVEAGAPDAAAALGWQAGAPDAAAALGHKAGSGPQTCELRLQAPGRHNLQNALAAVAVGLELGVPLAVIAEALASFEGVDRRFQRRGEAGGVLVVDDYAHHPTEIAAVMEAARATLRRRIIAVVQPHRYTRTAQLLDRFGAALRQADEVVLTDIYAAGEDPIPGVTVEALAAAMSAGLPRPVHLVKALDAVVPMVLSLVRPGDAVFTLGAGSISSIGDRLLAELRRTEGGR
jgi:UDP-N-acetylmuramate--alanine ligase